MSDVSAARRLVGTLTAAAGAPMAEPQGRRVAESPPCNRCGFPVTVRPWGCKNPCANCGTVYPLGDCSD